MNNDKSGQKVMKNVTGKELADLLQINGNWILNKGNAYDKKTTLDDICFAAKGGKPSPLSAIRSASPNGNGILELTFSCKSTGEEIFSCRIGGVTPTSNKQYQLSQAQNEIEAFFDVADELIRDYFN